MQQLSIPSCWMQTTANQVADVENLRIEPVVELHIVEALYAKFEVRNII